MATDIATLPEVRAVLTEVDTLEAFAKTYQVTTAEQYSAGAEDLKRVKAAQKKLDETRTGITGPMNAALKAVNDLFRTPGDRLARIERYIKQQLGSFADEQERIRREEQRKAEAEAQRQRERLEAQAAKASAAGKSEKAEQLQERAAAVVAPVIQREAPKVAGLASREAWKFEVVDPAQVPREYLMVDEQKIRRLVGAMKGETKIPGVKVWAERQLAAGAA
jgi:colicin import membrane protein